MSKPETKKLRVYMFEIAGVRYRMGAYRNAKVKAGDPLKFVPEPENPHDPKAIALYADTWHIGYVPRAWNDGVGQMLKDVGPEGVTCVVSEARPNTAYAEVYLDMTKTAPAEGAQDGQGP
jgi:hypothetical protein